MSIYGEFFIDFMKPFFQGFLSIFEALFKGLFEMFNILGYVDIVKEYYSQMGGSGTIIVILSSICLIIIFGVIILLIVLGIKRLVKYRKNLTKQEALVDEIEDLNADVYRLKAENEKFMNMADPENGEVEYDENGNVINKLKEGESRFFKLTEVDKQMESYVPRAFNETIGLNEFCIAFKNYAASKLKLYYDDKIIRLFISAFASNRLIILQGISGTGKTSLAYAFGNLIQNEAAIASVQPSWRDSTELFGYFNEFTKRFNETEVLSNMYEATYREDIFITLLDEMNISRVEYYFAEMLSILELPSREEWVIELVPNSWVNDPKKIIGGKLQIPANMWYIGTINNDDSTFMVTDKVYDRAMPIEINTKTEKFDAPETEGISIKAEYFESLFKKAQQEHPLSSELLDKLNKMDEYVIGHFRLAFGNRIVKQMKDFIPVYVACGGDELEAFDYVVAHKILRKFDQLNMSYVRNEIDPFIKYLNELFGENKMLECLEVLGNLKKMI